MYKFVETLKSIVEQDDVGKASYPATQIPSPKPMYRGKERIEPTKLSSDPTPSLSNTH